MPCEESWKTAAGFPDHIVSDQGRISVAWKPCGDYAQFCLASGHLHRNLTRDGKPHTVLVHALVLTTFRGPKKPGQVCRHLNGNPADNRLENLAWGTQAENGRDRAWHRSLGCPTSAVVGKITAANMRAYDDILALPKRIAPIGRRLRHLAVLIEYKRAANLARAAKRSAPAAGTTQEG